jgi:hypothetical protein
MRILRFFLLGLFVSTVFFLETDRSTASEHPLVIELLAPKAPSLFPALLWVKYDNLNYAHFDLGQLLADSVLLIDGQPAKRVSAYWGGVYNIAPGSSWDGCLQFNDYAPKISSGAHDVTLKFGNELSNHVSLRWSEPRSTTTLSPQDWLDDSHELARLIKPGLPRSCVEIWLTDQDGGVQGASKTRYYLRYAIKADVPYDTKPTPFNAQNRANGPVKIYREERFVD